MSSKSKSKTSASSATPSNNFRHSRPAPAVTLSTMSDRLAVPPEEFRAMPGDAADRIAAYYSTLADRPILVPTTSQALHDALAEPLPRDGADFPALLDQLDAT